MKSVKWGIIGCGDVAEVKSGPAFKKCEDSQLLAVMRRNAAKAKDFALRHQVEKWYDNTEELLQNKDINAVYIATPPSTHLALTLKAIEAGKNIYLEKPVTLDAVEAKKIAKALQGKDNKLVVAHYRRKLPAFLKVKDLVDENMIGAVRFVDIQILQPKNTGMIASSETNWRVNPSISGGGYFHDLAPHQIDLMLQYFGQTDKVEGFSKNQNPKDQADDIVNGMISFKNGIQFRGVWCFNVAKENKKDCCTIYGSKGVIEFSFYGDKVSLTEQGKKQEFLFPAIPHVQQPMIQAAVNYFLGKEPNPCPIEDGIKVMEVMDRFSKS